MVQTVGRYFGHAMVQTIGRYFGHAMVQTVGRQLFTAEARVLSPTSPCGICGEQRGNGTRHSPSSFPCQYLSINAPFSFLHLPLKVHNVSN